MIAKLQIWHLAWLAMAPVVFALFRLCSEPHDSDRVLIDNLLVVAGAIWAGFVAIYSVITGKKDDTFPNLLRLYRRLLEGVPFLWISNLIGTILVLFIVYKLSAFRQVEFVSPTDIEVHLNDKPSENMLVGIVRARTPTFFRLPIGEHLLVFRDLGSEKLLGSASIVVPSLVQYPAKVRKSVALPKEHEYGKAK